MGNEKKIENLFIELTQSNDSQILTDAEKKQLIGGKNLISQQDDDWVNCWAPTPL